MIVTLAALKVALDIAPDDTSEDEFLTALEAQAAAFVESQTGRRWQAPAARVEVIPGLGSRAMFLNGHLEATEVGSDDLPLVTMRQRAINARDWDDVDADSFERRDDTLINLDGRWSHLYEYEVSYKDGWTVAPMDIQALVIDLVSIGRSTSTEEGVKSETIGDYSYTLDSATIASNGSLTSESVATLNRRRSIHV